MGFSFNGTEYDLTPEQGAAMVGMYKLPPFSMTDTVIAGVLAQFKKTVSAAVKKGAETIFADVRARVEADETVKATMPQIVKTWQRYQAISKQLDELDEVVLTIAKNKAVESGLLADGIQLGFDSEHKLVLLPIKHGGSVAGSHRENGAIKITFKDDNLLALGTVIEGKNKQDLGKTLWPMIESKWAGVKPYVYEGKTFYNKMIEAIIADGLVEVEKVAA